MDYFLGTVCWRADLQPADLDTVQDPVGSVAVYTMILIVLN